MKSVSVRFRFVVIGVIAMVVVVSCCTFPLIPNTTVYVEIGNWKRANSKYNGPYVEWNNKDDFDKALARVRANPKGKVCICVLESSNSTPYLHKLNNDCNSEEKHCPTENVRTVKVTKSKAADKIVAGESVANDPNVMHRVQSPDPGDMINVLSTLKPAGP
jgi:hypothetical protein